MDANTYDSDLQMFIQEPPAINLTKLRFLAYLYDHGYYNDDIAPALMGRGLYREERRRWIAEKELTV